jgi:hypothetical protein
VRKLPYALACRCRIEKKLFKITKNYKKNHFACKMTLMSKKVRNCGFVLQIFMTPEQVD